MKWFNEETVLRLLKDIEKKPIDLECVKEVNGRLVPCLRSGIQIIPPKIEDYPSIELPDKHGRLIDADVIEDDIMDLVRTGELSDRQAGLLFAIVRHQAPTIIEPSCH